MNTIRPILTITILGAVAWFLYVQINKGTLRPPVPTAPTAGETAQTLSPAPPLDSVATKPKNSTTTDSKSATAGIAPQWPGESGGANNSPRYGASAATGSSATPSTPAIPDLPELPPVPQIVPDTAIKSDAGIATTPNSRYGSQPSAAEPMPGLPGINFGASDSGAALNSNDKTSNNSNFMPQAVGTNEHDSATENAMAAMGLTTGSSGSTSNPGARSAETNPGNRYGAANSSSSPTGSGAAGPMPTSLPANTNSAAVNVPSFSAAWPPIQSALERGELAKAHQLLSPWFGDPTLTPVEAERVDMLLGQLAGTVIYSTDHRLEPAYTVKPGDTLETIARQHEVPAQLLAKINGIATPDQLRTGRQIKVVRGPFGAMIDLRRHQLALSVDGRYAGKFSVSAPATSDFPPGEWVVAEKPATPAIAASVYAAPAGATTQNSPAVSRAIVLRAANNSARPGVIARIAASDTPITPIGGADADQKSALLLKVSQRDADELSDILSIGSRVVIQR